MCIDTSGNPPINCRQASAAQKSARAMRANHRRRAQPRANWLRGAPDQDGGQREHEYPAGDRSGSSGDQVHYEIYDYAPDRRTDDETLRQRHALVGLPQRRADDDVADGGERDQLGEQEQQSRDYRPINRHPRGLLLSGSGAKSGRA